MKLKQGFIISQVGEEYVAVATGEASSWFHGIVRLNETGAEIWKGLAEGLDREAIAAKLLREYDEVDQETALNAVDSIIEKLGAANILEE